MMVRTLFLLEPFPIRNTSCAQAWVGERLAGMLLSEDQGFALADMRIACNMPTLSHLAGMLPAARPYLLGLPALEEATFGQYTCDWHSIGLAHWRNIQAGHTEFEQIYKSLLQSLRLSYSFDVVAYWGTNESLRSAAQSLGIPTLWAEYGPLRPPFPTHFCLDAEGVNGLAPGREALRLREPASLPTIPGVALTVPAGTRSAYEATMAVPAVECASDFSTLMSFTKGKTEVILLVLQLGDDSNLITFGEGWTCQAMVETMLKLRAGPNVGFILRPHPGEQGTFHNMVIGEASRRAASDRDDVLIFDVNTHDAYIACVSVATEVVSINSSVGFEAALLGKPIRVLGSASYMPPGGGADLTAPPALLHDDSIDAFLSERLIPDSRFWKLACWREKANEVLRTVCHEVRMTPRLPTVAAKVLGSTRLSADGQVIIQGIGALPLVTRGVSGYLDKVVKRDTLIPQLNLEGWGVDPDTGNLFAGFVITTGQDSVWCSSMQHRPDVARHHRSGSRLATGFAINIALKDMPSAERLPIVVYGVTTSGACRRLNNEWRYITQDEVFAIDDIQLAV